MFSVKITNVHVKTKKKTSKKEERVKFIDPRCGVGLKCQPMANERHS
jgi:hypothetical protein